MNLDIALTLGVLLLAVALFMTEWLRVDLVALVAMAILLLAGVLSAEQAFAGFSGTATVTVAAMFVLSAGLFRTGAVRPAAELLSRLAARSPWLAVAGLMLIVGPLSAFINNTAAVAIFLPVALAVSRRSGVSPSRLLMPLSFASMFGGVCTLLGTSTNILVADIARQHGVEPFRMFEFSSLGLVLFAVGFLYMLFVGVRLIPPRRTAGDLTETFGLGDYLVEVRLLPGSEAAGKPLRDSPLSRRADLDVLEIARGEERIRLPSPATVLREGDRLRVRCDVEEIRRLEAEAGVELEPRVQLNDEILESADTVLLEAVVFPGSRLDGRSLAEIEFRSRYGATVLALRHRGELLHQELRHTILGAGDALLLEARRERLPQLRRSRDFSIVSELEATAFRETRVVAAVVIIAAVVTAAALDLLPIAAAAAVGAVGMVLTGCLTVEEAHEAIDWKVIFLLAGVLGLGVAMEQTGGAALLAGGLVAILGGWGPIALLSGFYLLSSLLTETMSNNATAVLLAPIAIVTAEGLGLSARPFLMAVTFAASASFMTPVGYQTNTLIYGPGGYRFSDFLRVGAPLNLAFWALATFLIPRIWPLS